MLIPWRFQSTQGTDLKDSGGQREPSELQVLTVENC